ncbi:MAG TPA: glycosyltransferase family A protein [Rhizomicrobium sp.]|nr:glycosyltransferase family A protein [Rhizomicrobium sp.]
MADVVIAIPSFRRPKGLERLLTALEKLKTSANVAVIVADNDDEKREAVQVSQVARSRGYRWPLDAFIEPRRGIANVRNALVARALEKHRCDFIAMIDDDEVPDEHWLDEMLRVQEQTRADALNGQTRRLFETDPGAWAVHCDGVSDSFAPTGPIAMLETTGNLLARRSLFENMAMPWFDPAFGMSGGEDKDFFMRAKSDSARFAWANEAIMYDHVPPSRANLKWALNRAYSAGNSDMRVFLRHRPAVSSQVREFARLAAALLLNPVLFAILSFNPNRRVRPLRKLYRALGKLAAIGGRHYDEYSVIHGQ